MEDLKKKIIDGEIAILKVVDMQGKFLRVERFDGCALILDLLNEPNAERMADLLALYNGQEIVVDDKRYSLICGEKLICEKMIETAENMSEGVSFSSDRDEEQFSDYLELIKGA